MIAPKFPASAVSFFSSSFPNVSDPIFVLDRLNELYKYVRGSDAVINFSKFNESFVRNLVHLIQNSSVNPRIFQQTVKVLACLTTALEPTEICVTMVKEHYFPSMLRQYAARPELFQNSDFLLSFNLIPNNVLSDSGVKHLSDSHSEWLQPVYEYFECFCDAPLDYSESAIGDLLGGIGELCNYDQDEENFTVAVDCLKTLLIKHVFLWDDWLQKVGGDLTECFNRLSAQGTWQITHLMESGLLARFFIEIQVKKEWDSKFKSAMEELIMNLVEYDGHLPVIETLLIWDVEQNVLKLGHSFILRFLANLPYDMVKKSAFSDENIRDLNHHSAEDWKHHLVFLNNVLEMGDEKTIASKFSPSLIQDAFHFIREMRRDPDCNSWNSRELELLFHGVAICAIGKVNDESDRILRQCLKNSNEDFADEKHLGRIEAAIKEDRKEDNESMEDSE